MCQLFMCQLFYRKLFLKLYFECEPNVNPCFSSLLNIEKVWIIEVWILQRIHDLLFFTALIRTSQISSFYAKRCNPWGGVRAAFGLCLRSISSFCFRSQKYLYFSIVFNIFLTDFWPDTDLSEAARCFITSFCVFGAKSGQENTRLSLQRCRRQVNAGRRRSKQCSRQVKAR